MLNLCRKLEKTEIIGDGSTLLSHPVGHLLLGEIALLNKSLIAESHLDRVQILPLDILHNGHLEHSLIAGIPYICRNHVHTGETAGAETPLATYNLVSVSGFLPDSYRLNQSQCPDGGRQFLQCLLVE